MKMPIRASLGVSAMLVPSNLTAGVHLTPDLKWQIPGAGGLCAVFANLTTVGACVVAADRTRRWQRIKVQGQDRERIRDP